MASFRSNQVGSIFIQPTQSLVGIKDIFTQPGHTFQPGAAVCFASNGTVQGAISTSLALSSVIGIVESVNGSDFTVVYQGEIEFSAGTTSSFLNFPLVTGNTYYLSAAITGGVTGGYSVDSSSIIKPLMIPSGGYKGLIINSLPLSSTPLVTLFSPVGSIVPYAGKGNNVSAGWLLCAGDALAKQSTSPAYKDLYDIIGEKYGVYGITRTSTSGLTAYVQFDGSVEDAPTSGPGSTKNHSIENNDVFKMVWGSNQSVVQAYSATGTTNNVTFKFITSITGSTSFNSIGVGTEFALKSLVNGESVGYTSDKFFIPDLRGRSVVGAGTGRGLTNRTIGTFGGQESHVLSESEIPAHSHNIPILNSAGVSGTASYLLDSSGNLTATLSSFPQVTSPVSGSTGASEAHENMPPFLTTNWIIRYRSNVGMAGIETGPRGEQGTTGSTGAQGTTGTTGVRGATGYALGALHYSYTSVAGVPPGYLSTQTYSGIDNLVLSSEEYYGVGVGDYITATMSNTNSQRNALAIIRSLRDPSAFARVYSLKGAYTVVNATGPSVLPSSQTDTGSPQAIFVSGDTLTYYRLPITTVLSQYGNFVEGEMYSVILLPSANDGAKGATGATGARGATGSTGLRGETGSCGCTAGPTGFASKNDSTSIFVSIDGASVGLGSGGLNSTDPYGFSTDELEPTDWDSFKYALDGTYVGHTPEITQPIWPAESIKNNFKYSLQLTSQPCGGNCVGSSGYISLCDSVRRTDNLNYYTAPKETNIGLVATSTNSVFNSDVTQVVDGCKVNIFGYTGSYFTKIPVGISAGFLNSSAGSTGRNRVAIDILMDTNNVVVGNYIGIRPEYFSIGVTASLTGHQTLAGIHKIESINGTSARAYTSVPFGVSGSDMFTGYIAGGIGGNFDRVDVYTVSVNFQECSGYLVNSGELTLGLSSYGLPFVVSFAGTTGSEAAKAVLAVASGSVRIGEGMAFYGWPTHGAALYSSRGGNIVAHSPIISNCGVGVYSKSNSDISLSVPVLTSNSLGMFAEKSGSISSLGVLGSHTTTLRNEILGIVDNSSINIKDSFAVLQTDTFQAGFYFAGNSDLSIVGGYDSLGLSGTTGLSSIAIGSTGATGTTASGSNFITTSQNSSGSGMILVGNGIFQYSVTGNSRFTASVGRGKVVNAQFSVSALPPNNNFLVTLLPSEPV